MKKSKAIKQDKDVKSWLKAIEPIIKMIQDFKKKREQQSQESNEDAQ